MKKLFSTLGTAITIVIGFKAGEWLWTDVLSEKAVNLKNRLSKKD